MAKYELSSKKNTVILGDKEFTRYFLAGKKSYHQFLYWAKEEGFDVYDGNGHPKEVNKVLCGAFGSKIPLRFSAAMHNVFIRDNIPREAYFAVSHLGHKWNIFNPQLVNTAAYYNHLVQQAVRDNTLNLLPLMLHKKMDTQQLKAHYGKGLWKRLANTSKSRMRYLSVLIDDNPEWADIRTCILSQTRVALFNSDKGLIAAKIAPKGDMYSATCHMVNDTLRMARQMGVITNPNWSYKRWQEEHDNLSKAILTRSYSDTPFTEVVTYEEGPYTFTLLNNRRDIALEGSTMRHCVGSYAEKAARGGYAVFKVEGKERATLGLHKHHSLVDGTSMRFDQCYGFGNSRCSDELIAAAYKILGRHNDYCRLRDGRVSGSSDQDPRSVLDYGRQAVPLDQRLRGNEIPAVWIDDLNWA